MAARIPVQRLVIGIGNEFRQDDGAGIAAARRLRHQAPAGVTVLERSGEGTGLMAAWQGAGFAIVVDAVSSGADPGTIHRFEVTGPLAADTGSRPRQPPRIFRGTSHQIGLGEAIDLAAAIGALPERLVIYGVEGRAFGEGIVLSPEVARAVEDVVARMAEDIGRECEGRLARGQRVHRTRRSTASARPASS
ncbi:MAG: hydrogenase maturation protease [Acidobacteriota bacterium]